MIGMRYSISRMPTAFLLLTSHRTPLKNCFYIQYIVAQNIQIYFILCCFAQNKDFFSGVLAEVGVSTQTEMTDIDAILAEKGSFVKNAVNVLYLMK